MKLTKFAIAARSASTLALGGGGRKTRQYKH